MLRGGSGLRNYISVLRDHNISKNCTSISGTCQMLVISKLRNAKKMNIYFCLSRFPLERAYDSVRSYPFVNCHHPIILCDLLLNANVADGIDEATWQNLKIWETKRCWPLLIKLLSCTSWYEKKSLFHTKSKSDVVTVPVTKLYFGFPASRFWFSSLTKNWKWNQ